MPSSTKATKAKMDLAAPRCPHCGFDMTPLHFGRDLGIEALDQIHECRPCGVMTVPDPPPPADSPTPAQ